MRDLKGADTIIGVEGLNNTDGHVRSTLTLINQIISKLDSLRLKTFHKYIRFKSAFPSPD